MKTIIPIIPFVFLSIFLPDFLKGKIPSLTVLVVAVVIAGVFSIWLRREVSGFTGKKGGEKLESGRIWFKLMVIIVIYILVFSGLTIIKYNAYSYSGRDATFYSQALWSALHGKFFYCTIKASEGVSSQMFDHIEPIMFLMLPFYAVFSSSITIFFLRTILLALGAFPLFLIAREKLGGRLALIIAGIYLLHPDFMGQHFIDPVPMHFLPFFFFFSFYYFVKKRIIPFIIWFVLTISLRIDLAPMLFMFAILALLEKRKWIWIIAPAFLSIAWAFVGLKLISPIFTEGKMGFHQITQYSSFGATPIEILKNMLADPVETIKFLWDPVKIKIILITALPFFIILGINREIIFALPHLLGILLLPHSSSGNSFFQGYTHDAYYLMPIVCAFFLGFIRNLSYLKTKIKDGSWIVRSIVICSLLFTSLYALRSELGNEDAMGSVFTPTNTNTPSTVIAEAIKLIPIGKNVLGPLYIIHHLSKNRELASNPSELPGETFDYIIIDKGTKNWYCQSLYKEKYFKKLAENKDYRLIFSKNGLLIYQGIFR